MKGFALTLLAIGALTGPANAQMRRAAMVSGGNNQSGKCTVEVVVDGTAEVEVRGDTAQLRNISGQPPQWRRFECTGPLPANPVDFRFQGIDGRGRQELVRDPRNGGAAVVRIEDQNGGQEAYTFDLTWGGGNGYPGGPNGAGAYPAPGVNPGNYQYRWGGRPVDRQYAANQAVNVCRDAVRQEAMNRYNPGRVEFREMRLEDNPGRRDWVVGNIDMYQRGGREDHFQFSCAVNFDNGRVRSVQIEPAYARGDYDRGSADRSFSPTDRAIQGCQGAVMDRMRNDGWRDVDIRSIRMDEGRGRNDYVVGEAMARRGGYGDAFRFSCSVDPRDGDVRNVNIDRR